ncbi:flap endonuclease 1-like isoform X2 [Nicotiana tabacum]|uniref:Flap endonuclease 1-like isoform X2 n=3 Tax=Nicotiana tabacum TaxID=4097 RepID=A0AC58UUT2_TOBAC
MELAVVLQIGSYCWAVCKLRKRYGQQSWLKSILKRGFCLCCGIEDMDSLKSGASRSFHHLMDPSFEHIPPAQLDELELNIDQFITSEYCCGERSMFCLKLTDLTVEYFLLLVAEHV